MLWPLVDQCSLIIPRSSRSQLLFRIGVLRNFVIFTGKHLCWSLFDKVESILQHISRGYCEIFKNSFFKMNISGSYFCISIYLAGNLLIKRQSCHHIETSRLICRAYQLNRFYMMATLAFNEFRPILPTNNFLLYPLKASENQRVSDSITRYRMGTLTWSELSTGLKFQTETPKWSSWRWS